MNIQPNPLNRYLVSEFNHRITLGIYKGEDPEDAIQACFDDPAQASILKELSRKILAQKASAIRFQHSSSLEGERLAKALEASGRADPLSVLRGEVTAQDCEALVRMHSHDISAVVSKRMAASEETTTAPDGSQHFETKDLTINRICFAVECDRYPGDDSRNISLKAAVIAPDEAVPMIECPLLASASQSAETP